MKIAWRSCKSRQSLWKLLTSEHLTMSHSRLLKFYNKLYSWQLITRGNAVDEFVFHPMQLKNHSEILVTIQPIGSRFDATIQPLGSREGATTNAFQSGISTDDVRTSSSTIPKLVGQVEAFGKSQVSDRFRWGRVEKKFRPMKN